MANEVVTELTAKNTTLNPVLDAGERSVLRFADSVRANFLKISGAIAAAFTIDQIQQWATAAANALKDFAMESIFAAQESEEAWAKWNATQRAAGDEIKLTNEQLDSLASSIQSLTRFEDEAIVNAASLLSVYQNLNTEALEKTLILAADMSALFGGDLSSSAMQLGRALDNPTQGMRILRAVGVNLDEETKALIETFVKAGNIQAAQSVIIEELEERFSGLAEAMGETSAGRVDKLNNRFGELKETIGRDLLPMFEALITSTEAFATGFESGMGEAQADKVKKIADEADRLNKIILEMGAIVPNIGAGLQTGALELLKQHTIQAMGIVGVPISFMAGLESMRGPSGIETLIPGDPNFKGDKAAREVEEKQAAEEKRLQDEEDRMNEEDRIGAIGAGNDEAARQFEEKRLVEERELARRAQEREDFTPGERGLNTRGDKAASSKGSKSPDFESSFEDLVSLNRRITAAAQDSPEKQIEKAVIDVGAKTVEKLDALKKPLDIMAEKIEKIDSQQTPFEQMNPLDALV